MAVRSFMVRVFATAAAVVPPVILMCGPSAFSNTRHGEGHSEFTTLLILLTALISIPGGYLAIVGAKSTPTPGLRKKCVIQIATAFGMLLLWAAVMAVGNAFAYLLGFGFLWYGILGVAAVLLTLGILSLVSNRDLVREMAHITISGQQHAAGDKVVEDLFGIAAPASTQDESDNNALVALEERRIHI